MTSDQSFKGDENSMPGVIFAAGGIVWRETFRGPEVVVINRLRYGEEWCLPKGKPDKGESLDKTAIREVKEETGCDVQIKSFAGTTQYQVNEIPKVVLFWNMNPTGECSFKSSEEVREMLWLAPCEAIKKLTHQQEKELLENAYGQRSSLLPQLCYRWIFNRPLIKLRPEDRLAGSIQAYSVELERRIKHAQEKRESDLCWGNAARMLLCKAQAALEEKKTEEGWKCFHAAQRMEMFGLEKEELGAVACVIREESEKLNLWRKKAVHELIGDSKSPKDINEEKVYQAACIRDDHYNNQYHKIGLIRYQLKTLSVILICVLIMLFIYFGVKYYINIYDEVYNITGVILFGLLGGTVSAILSTGSSVIQSRRIPELVSHILVTSMRVSLGAASALVIYVFLNSELFDKIFKFRPVFLYTFFAISFVAGFSERLVLKAVESVAGKGQ